MLNNEEVLLRVENLRQYFGSTKAVDNVSFDIKKGEVFGLVGESGCGKTTTGRSIIKLYNITGGNVFFKGIRIAAGKYSYVEAIKNAKADYEEKVKANPEKAAELKAERDAIIAKQREEMKKADFEQQPPMFQVSDTHFASTWLLHPDAPKVNPPKTILDRIARMKAKRGAENAE